MNSNRLETYTCAGVAVATVLAMCTFGFAGANDPQDEFRQRLATVMANARSGIGTPAIDTLAASNPAAALDAAAEYVADASPEVRRTACAIACHAGLASNDPKVRLRAVGLLIGATDDSDSLVWQHACTDLLRFTARDYDAQAKASLATALSSTQPRRETARLVGLAEMRDQMPRLDELLIDESKYETGRQAGRWYGTVSWAARLARARMGDDAELERCIELVESEGEHVTRVTVLLADLAYTRRPAAMAHIGRYLGSDDELPSTKIGSPGTPYSQYAIDVLADALPDFPVPRTYVGAYTDEDIRTARAWMRERYPTVGR